MNLDNLKYHSIIGALRCVAILPLPVLYLFSDFARFILHKVLKYRVDVVRKNLRNSFPEKNGRELRRIENDFYAYLCDVFIEAVKLLHISDRQLLKRVRMENLEILHEEGDNSHSTILFLGHYGNWEWIPSLTLHIHDILLCQIYKPLHDKVMDRVMKRIRSRFTSVGITNRTAYRTLLGYKRDGLKFITGFIADQRPVGQPLHHWTLFLNQPTAFLAGAETIGDRVGSRYVFAEMIRLKRGNYCLRFHSMTPDPADKEPYPYTRLYLAMLEKSIKEHPAQWLWSHNKWKSELPEDAILLKPANINYNLLNLL